MYEQTDAFEVRDRILSQQQVQDMDAHDRAALAKEISVMQLRALEHKLDELTRN